MAAITWLYADSDGNAAAQTKTASALAFSAGDRILTVGLCIPNGYGDSYLMGATSTASTNSVTWSTLATGATNTYDSVGFPAKLVLLISSELTATESFDVSLDPHTGNTQDYYIALGVARLTGVTGSLAQAAVGAIAGANVDDATCTFASAPTAGNLQLMIVGHIAGDDSVTWDAVPTDFAQVSGSTAASVGLLGFSAIASTTATATAVTWGYENGIAFKYGVNAVAVELAAAGGPAIHSQSAYRWGLDDGSETTHTWDAAENAPISAAAAQRRLARVQIDNNTGADITSAYRLQYKRADEADTEWRDV